MSSTRIVEIISVINNIAFHTNILALNAAVEAARAGEHGRGFAVVAAEVRNRAHRASSTANEIESLISESASEIRNGGQLVDEAEETISASVETVNPIAALMRNIADASGEHSYGIEHINERDALMNKVTQRNAALQDEAAAAARGQLVSVFRLKKVVPYGLLETPLSARYLQSSGSESRKSMVVRLRSG